MFELTVNLCGAVGFENEFLLRCAIFLFFTTIGGAAIRDFSSWSSLVKAAKIYTRVSIPLLFLIGTYFLFTVDFYK